MEIRFDGERVIVTGAGHGIGRGIAQEFAALGAEVLALDVNKAGLDETAGGGEGLLTTGLLDVTDPAAVRSVVEGFGPASILVHSAGGVRGQVGRPLEEITPADWSDIVDVNMKGAFLMAQAVVPEMKKLRRGRIITISSGAGLGVSLTGIQAYAAAKAGEIGLTRQLAHELGPFGITVNSIAPGFVRSNPTTERQWDAYGPEGQERLTGSIFMRRTGRVEDISGLTLFLASDRAEWITGQVIQVNGGRA
ncbi:SDR family NAD(P)-dependent oxidoreductase [Szabonella alba]|uniref:SDR family oxidoreductase n=1 Tax=Szabonella alba TaxID=2804194 RepID=A0A8K0Y065_9RHOB|nr:SDR family NAD(P)-dependent oxidoreductase [Szabonella alba]MBL4916788.1 SDR family oxidoreductase [Szabonella alba]